MATLKIASRFVRTFNNGEHLTKVVTQVNDGKIFTNVYNKDGCLLKSRVKLFSDANVGDKFVKTRMYVLQLDSGVVSKTVENRVYNKANLDGKRVPIGYRITSEEIFKGHKLCKKRLVNLQNGSLNEKILKDKIVCTKTFKNGNNINFIDYNNLGLPMPKVLNNIEAKDLSINEMYIKALEKDPSSTYFPSGYYHKINNLDVYL